MKVSINDYNLAMSYVSNPEEFRSFKKAFMWLQSSLYNYEAVQGGRWCLIDAESVVNAETLGKNMTPEQSRELRLKQLKNDIEKASALAVKKMNRLNKAYYEKTGNYIVGYYKDRDLLLKNALIDLARVA